MPVFWPARIVTPEATYEPAHLRFSHGEVAELLDKAGQAIATMDQPDLVLVFESPGFVRQRWQVSNSDGERWLVEVIDHCGCGSTRTTASNPIELAW